MNSKNNKYNTPQSRNNASWLLTLPEGSDTPTHTHISTHIQNIYGYISLSIKTLSLSTIIHVSPPLSLLLCVSVFVFFSLLIFSLSKNEGIISL
uniref:Uncharacterized protein n=1 Tax=Rhizophora mucronata TaxID=61149 RepID=A0A2P2M0J5_RHIMU